MTSFARSGSTLRARYPLGLLALAAMLPVGCSNMTSTATQSATATPQVRIKGRLHGGNQPVSGATVTVYFAGQTGYGSASTAVTTATTANDGYGSFSFSVSCPVQPYQPLVYLVATGGNTLNNGSTSTNSAAEFLAALAPCDQVNSSTFVDMSEVTTVATMAALQQYFNPATKSFGVDGILLGYTAMANAMATIPNLVDYTSGTAVSTLTKTATANGSSVSVTVTPETAKINTLANIISACINNNANGDATACTTLESNANPPTAATTSQPGGTFAGATDLLTALYYVMTNPTNGGTSHLNAIYGIAPGTGAPYQPTLSTAPTDWTIGVTYSSTSNCTNGDGFFDRPYDLKLDARGNVWIDNGPNTNGNLARMQFDGMPLTCTAVAAESRGSTIDDQGNIWVGSFSTNNIYRYNPNTGVTLTFTTLAPVVAITADGSDNVFFSTYAGTALYEIVSGATTTIPIPPVPISSTMGNAPAQIMVDASGTIWGSTGTTAVTATAATAGVYATTPYTVSGNSYGISIVPGNAGNIFISSQNTNSIDLLGSTGNGASNFPAYGGGLNNPTAISADGARNVWAANNVTGVSTVSEFTNGGVPLSPASGFAKAGPYLVNGRSIIVDQGGNVWISRDGSNLITEIIGAGVPIYQPASIGIHQGRFQTLP